MVPITPMPHYSDMDTPDLKDKLNRSVSSLSFIEVIKCGINPITFPSVTVNLLSLSGSVLWLRLISSCPSVHLSITNAFNLLLLHRFGVRPLPKRQMILKLKEIHQYTHQLAGSDSDDETAFSRPSAQVKPPPSRPVSCTQTVTFKEPRVPAATSPVKHSREEKEEEDPPLSASQGSNTSSTAASEESERYFSCQAKRLNVVECLN